MKYFYILLITIISISCSKDKVGNSSFFNSEKENEENITILIDVSLTMVSKDFKPDRISAVKEAVRKMIENKKPNQAFSVVVFSANSYVVCPLTKDRNKLLNSLGIIKEFILKLKAGTDFSDALLTGIYTLKDQKNGSIIIFSDGNYTKKSYPLDLTINYSLKHNIVINAVVVAPDKIQIVPTYMDLKGNFIFEEMKAQAVDSTLQKISEKTNGFYKRYMNENQLSTFNFQKSYSAIKLSNNVKIEKTHELESIFQQVERVNDSIKMTLNKKEGVSKF